MVSCGSGVLCCSMALTPAARRSHWMSAPVASTTRTTASVMSGPIPSPGISVTVCGICSVSSGHGREAGGPRVSPLVILPHDRRHPRARRMRAPSHDGEALAAQATEPAPPGTRPGAQGQVKWDSRSLSFCHRSSPFHPCHPVTPSPQSGTSSRAASATAALVISARSSGRRGHAVRLAPPDHEAGARVHHRRVQPHERAAPLSGVMSTALRGMTTSRASVSAM